MAKPSNPNHYILGLDVGAARIGMAVASTIARLPRPLEVLLRTDNVFDDIVRIAEQEKASMVVVGVPRNMDGQETTQSREIRDFADQLGQKTNLNIVFADESLSSVRAEAIAHGDKKLAQKHLDSIAACYILEEFLNQKDIPG